MTALPYWHPGQQRREDELPEDHAIRLEEMRKRYERDEETCDARMDAARDRRDERANGRGG